jgi:KUP system potassium uptake protein
MMHNPTAQDMPPLPLFDEEALDIANCLGAEPDADDIHTDKTRRRV